MAFNLQTIRFFRHFLPRIDSDCFLCVYLSEHLWSFKHRSDTKQSFCQELVVSCLEEDDKVDDGEHLPAFL